MIYWFFGIPGSGKSFVADRFSVMTGIRAFNGDDFHSTDDRKAIEAGKFTLAHRHTQLTRIAHALRALGKSDAIVTHPLPDRESRARIQRLYSDAGRLVYVKAPIELIKHRLGRRTGHHFRADQLDAWIPKHWQEPVGENCFVIENGPDDEMLKLQLMSLDNECR